MDKNAFKKIGLFGGGVIGVKVGQVLVQEIFFSIGKYTYPFGPIAEAVGGMIGGAIGAKLGETAGSGIDSATQKEVQG